MIILPVRNLQKRQVCTCYRKKYKTIHGKVRIRCFHGVYSVCFLIQVLQSWLQGLPDDYTVKDLINTVYMIQVLQSWLQDLPDDFAVKDLINELKDWIEDEYVKDAVWKRLQNCVTPGVLPTFSKRRSARKRSGSLSAGDVPVKKKPAAVPSLTGKITLHVPC